MTRPRFPSVPMIREAMADQTEAEVKRAVCDYLTLHNYHWIRVQSGQVRGSYKGRTWVVNCAPPGTADILVVLPPNGYALWLEIKSHKRGSGQSPEQEAFAAKMTRLGAGYRIVRDLDQLISGMREEVENAKVRVPDAAGGGE